jgi:cellobiose phosphorylase
MGVYSIRNNTANKISTLFILILVDLWQELDEIGQKSSEMASYSRAYVQQWTVVWAEDWW